MKDKLILKDGNEIELEAGASLGAIQVLSTNKEAMVATWDKFTDANLSEVQVKNSEGLTIGSYANLTLVSETSTVQLDASILTSYCLRHKTDVENRLDTLEIGQEVQDGAITELAVLMGGE